MKSVDVVGKNGTRQKLASLSDSLDIYDLDLKELLFDPKQDFLNYLLIEQLQVSHLITLQVAFVEWTLCFGHIRFDLYFLSTVLKVIGTGATKM